MSLHTLNIRLDFPYRTGFTHGAFRPENDALASLMEQRPGSRVLVLLEKGLEQFYPQLPADIDRYFEKNAGVLAYAGCRSVPGGEEAKTGFSAWETALRHIVEAGIDRHSYIIAVGGGAFLDVAGFAAATAHSRHPAVAHPHHHPLPGRLRSRCQKRDQFHGPEKLSGHLRRRVGHA